MKTKDIKKYIEKATDKYADFKRYCDAIAIEAQKHIDWIDDITCDMVPGDGLCIETDPSQTKMPMIIPVTSFFDAVKKKEDGMLTYEDLSLIAI